MDNPFIHGRAVTAAEFLGRQTELRRVFGRLSTRQSVAITGQPHIGKTSVLKYVLDPQARQDILGDRFERDLFSFLDALTLRSVDTQADFWELALSPLFQCFGDDPPEHLKPLAGALKSLAPLYETARQNKFGVFVLEQLLTRLNAAGTRLVLLIDEFDNFLNHQVLYSAEFFGGLRSLGSRAIGLVLLIAARRDIEELTHRTQEINPLGSPYFNFMTEVKLGPFTKKETSALLDRAGERFTRPDREFVKALCGRHPYLLQTAAAMLWEVYDEAEGVMARYQSAARAMYRETERHFADTWRLYNSKMRKVVIGVALAQITNFLNDGKLLVDDLIDNLNEYLTELELLEDNGILVRNEDGHWRLAPGAFLWWLADDLRRSVRDFPAWLLTEKMGHLLTPPERQQIGLAVTKGAAALIEAHAKKFSAESAKELPSS